jgi:hypothetical protein
MKARWWMAVCVAALFVLFNGGAVRAQGHSDHDNGRGNEHHDEGQDQDHGHGHGHAYGHENHEHHWDSHHPQFDYHEREVGHDWWEHHRDYRGEGFRDEDRLPRDWEPRLRAGFVFDRDWRARCYPVPADLYAELPPPPRYYRYYVIGGNVVLVDRGWRVADVIDINF